MLGKCEKSFSSNREVEVLQGQRANKEREGFRVLLVQEEQMDRKDPKEIRANQGFPETLESKGLRG